MAMFHVKSPGSEEVNPGTCEIFRALTGAEWTDIMLFPEEEELHPMKPVSNAEYELMRFLLPAYQAYKKKPPQLYLLQGADKGFHSVHAAEMIPKGTVVTEYLGEWRPTSTKPSGYRWGPIDGLHFRNLGGMVEDGFPNVAAFYLYHIGDAPKRVIFIALEEIAKDAMIAVDYGMGHSVKVQYHSEYRAEVMKTFFSRNPLHKIFSRIKELQGRTIRELGWKRVLELENLACKVRYLFHTPSALMQLLLDKVFGDEELRRYYSDPEYRYFILGFPLKQNYRHKEVSEHIEQVFQYIQKGQSDTARVQKLCAKLRQRVLHRVFLQGLLLGGDPAQLEIEASIWNEGFDAIQQGDRDLVAFKIEQVARRDDFMRECLFYAREIHSPLLPWLQHLTEPPQPLSPTG